MPCSTVRRDNARLVTNMQTLLRLAFDFRRIWNGVLFTIPMTSAENRSLLRAGVAHDAAHHRHVVRPAGRGRAHRSSASRSACCTNTSGCSQQRRAQPGHAHGALAVGHRAFGVDRRRPPRASRHAPTALKFSSVKPSPSIVRWQLAHDGLARWLSSRSRIVRGFALAVCSNGGTFAGGAGGGVPSRFSRIHLPRSVGAVRSACEVASRMLPLPSSPRRASPASVDAAELAAVDVRQAVVPRQPLVHERVVGGHQVQHVAILAHDAGEEELGLAPEARRAGRCRSPGTRRCSARCSAGCGCAATARRSSRTSACGLRVGQHAAHLRLEHRGLAQAPRRGQVEQRVVGHAAPEEERQARRQLDVADAIGRARRDGRAGSSSTRKMNVGLASRRRSASWMPVSKLPFLRPSR